MVLDAWLAVRMRPCGVGRVSTADREAGSSPEPPHVLFRDYLRSHPDVARQYEKLKRELVARHTNGNAYAEDKTDFVRETLALAREWRRGEALEDE